nr:phosphate-repressible acid phosphatase [Quercus suber]
MDNGRDLEVPISRSLGQMRLRCPKRWKRAREGAFRLPGCQAARLLRQHRDVRPSITTLQQPMASPRFSTSRRATPPTQHTDTSGRLLQGPGFEKKLDHPGHVRLAANGRTPVCADCHHLPASRPRARRPLHLHICFAANPTITVECLPRHRISVRLLRPSPDPTYTTMAGSLAAALSLALAGVTALPQANVNTATQTNSVYAAQATAKTSQETSFIPGLAFDRFVTIWLENTDYSKAAGDPNLAYLASKGITLQNYFGGTLRATETPPPSRPGMLIFSQSLTRQSRTMSLHMEATTSGWTTTTSTR